MLIILTGLCVTENSSSDNDQQLVVEPYYLQLFWSCQDDCAYDCMWLTVSAFQKQGWGVPQFFGRVNFILLHLVAEKSIIFHFCSGRLLEF